ncbi:hypothetical protein QJS66_02185 [Kocuria rhizophila]|nr:hypothetical protein QJS66_02185 [Kocuria rhizophila]
MHSRFSTNTFRPGPWPSHAHPGARRGDQRRGARHWMRTGSPRCQAPCWAASPRTSTGLCSEGASDFPVPRRGRGAAAARGTPDRRTMRC